MGRLRKTKRFCPYGRYIGRYSQSEPYRTHDQTASTTRRQAHQPMYHGTMYTRTTK